MANLIDIRRRIKSTKNTQQITKAMKMVSASRLRRASERALKARPYAERILDVHHSILEHMTEVAGTLYREQEGRTLIVVVSGDKGLCGAFNSNIFKRAEALIEEEPDYTTILPIGKKSVSYFGNHYVQSLDGYSGIFRDLTADLAESIAQRLTQLFLEEDFGKVVLLYNKFKNVLVQVVTEQQLLPITTDEEAEEEEFDFGSEHLAEPSLGEILDELSPRVVMTEVFQALLESCAAEHAARMTAMDAATNNAKDMIESLTLEMNKARQAAITKELIEVVSGAAAL